MGVAPRHEEGVQKRGLAAVVAVLAHFDGQRAPYAVRHHVLLGQSAKRAVAVGTLLAALADHRHFSNTPEEAPQPK